MKPISLDALNRGLTIEEVVLAARGQIEGQGHLYPQIVLATPAKERLRRHRQGLLDAIKAQKIMYGVNTGCGSQKGVIIESDEILRYQERYIRAHSTGIGKPFPKEITRAAMLLRVNSFTNGNSAMSLGLCETILDMLNKDVVPLVPQQGSVGSSGDLAPLAHLGAALIGLPEQKVWYQGKIHSAPQALYLANIKPIRLGAKEAMGLTNGATFSLATLLLAYYDARKLFTLSNLVMAMSLEAVRGEMDAFDSRIHRARKHSGQIKVAAQIREYLKDSEWVTPAVRHIELPDEHKERFEDGEPKPRVQDAYSFRCHAQVAGSVLHTLDFVEQIIANEVNASTDNPLVFRLPEKDDFDVLSGGNFHGEPLAHAADYLKIAIQSLANVSNARFYAMLSPHTSYGLPPNLAGQSERDLNTGLMILQYSVASLVSENKVLCHPASVDSIPTSAGQEDYVSMAPIAARHARQVVENTYAVVAAELIAASQGIALVVKKLNFPRLGKFTARLYQNLRNWVPAMMAQDRYLHADWKRVIKLLKEIEL